MIGRFIQEDTYYGDGLNLYEYCRNNAITYKDPTGHNICPTQRDLYHKYKEEGMSLQEAYQKMRKELGLDSKSGYKDSGVGNGKDPWRSYESGSKPIGATYEGTIYRSVDSRYDPLEMSQYTINSNHRYTESGVPGLHFSSGEKIVKAELGNYDVFDFSNRTMYSYDVRLTNMLDVSNPSVRSQLGISLESIVGEGYDVTHAIGRYAYSNGYNGIIAPSARADGGINIIIFNAKGGETTMDMLEMFFYEYEEEAWNRYASCFEDVNTQIDGVPQEIVNAIFTILGDATGYDWLHKPLHKFGGKSAVELLKTEKGEKALKAFIMRLPN